MGDEYNKEACDEKHKNLHTTLERLDKNLDRIYTRLNWFYLVAIATLISTAASIIVSCAKG